MSTSSYLDDSATDPDDELLVAYLDGELDRNERTELENRLIEDEPLRERLTQLQSGWEYLDALPSPSVSSSLVVSTLELAIKDIDNVPVRGTGNSRSTKFWILTGLLGLVSVVIGFAVAKYLRNREFQQNMRDLAIVENLDAYRLGDDLVLMRLLASDQEWVRMQSTTQELKDISTDDVTLSELSIQDRPQAIDQMTSEHRLQLQARWERFQRFDEATKRSIRVTADAVSKQSDSQTLLATMRAYARWRPDLSDELIEQIESGDAKTRRLAIAKANERSKMDMALTSGVFLDDATVERIYYVLRKALNSRLKFIRRLNARNEYNKQYEWQLIRFHFESESPGEERWLKKGAQFGGPRKPLRPNEFENLRLVLPDDAVELLELVATGEPLLEELALQSWVDEAIRRKSPLQKNFTMAERYEKLDRDDREAVDLLPAEQILKTLSRDELQGL